jgi:hypothetical protein
LFEVARPASRRRLWLTAILSLAVVVDAEAICLPVVRQVGDDPAYGYAATFIEALSHGKRSLDNLIRPRQQRRRDGEAEGLRCLHVDDQFELHRLFDG